MTDDSLQALFAEVVALIRDTPVTPDLNISDTDKLQMYGLYKQATVGPCDEAEAPSRFQLVARAKYQAWLDCREMTIHQAMLAYVELAASNENWLGETCSGRLLEWKESSTSLDGVSNDEPGGDRAAAPDSAAPLSVGEECRPNSASADAKRSIEYEATQQTTWFHPLLDKHFGIRPLIPRGQLDISYRDLAFAAWQCMRKSPSMSRYCQLEQQVSDKWNSPEPENSTSIITGLSVRSLLDLYLRAASFSAGSEIIMSPPINIPGIMDILRHHCINVVPMDMPAGGNGHCVVAVDVDEVKKAVTEKTVAIMIVHPFGMLSTTDQDMKALRFLADERSLFLLEDCAECFAGLGPDCYKGSAHADVSFFSFGSIKTATALGGGIAVLRDSTKADKMNRMHHFLYKQQSATEYLCKVLWCTLVRFIADSPLLYGVLFALFSWMGLDFDEVVSSSTRGFAPMKQDMTLVSNQSESGMRYMNQLRKRPSPALLSVLARRLQQSQSSVPSVKSRVERCKCMTSMLQKLAPNVEMPVAVSAAANTYWLFPIQVEAPDTMSRKLRKQGFDVPRGLSQLESISKYSSNSKSCNRADELMNRILYLPVASRRMSKGDIRLLAIALNAATRAVPEVAGATERHNTCRTCRSLRVARNQFTRIAIFLLVVIAIAYFDALLFRFIPLSSLILAATRVASKLFAMTLAIAIVAVVAMRWTMADFYLNSSKCFAKYSSMLFREPPCKSGDANSSACRIPGTDKDSKPLLDMDVLRLPPLEAAASTDADTSADGDAVLLTGATGFIGRLLLRDLLLHRDALSILGGVVVLCRSKRGMSACDRIVKLLDDPMYSFLSEAEKQNLVHVIEGDVTKPNVGLSIEDADEVCSKLRITHVVHCAASVSFTQTLKDAAVSNITSSLNLQSLTGRLSKKSAQYIHISTAFVHGGLTGTACEPLPEQLHSLDGYDAAELYQSMLGTEFLASVAMNELGFPNTYTFSKCICEHLLARNKNVSTVVLRPSIVGPAVQQPYEGWAGDKPTTIVAAACLYMSYQWNLWCFGDHRVPYIPVDIVSKNVIAKCFANRVAASETSSRECDTPAASSSDDGFEKLSQMSDSSVSVDDEIFASTPVSFEEDRAQREQFTIHNCAWDSTSPDSAMFTWIDYAIAVTHLGAVLGYFSRLTAYIGLFVTVRILPGMKVKEQTFRTLHQVLVQVPIDTIVSWFQLLGWCPLPMEKLTKLSAFLDLPLLFFHFMNNDFYFASDLVAPEILDGERYLFSCAAAAENFVSSIKARHENKVSSKTVTPVKREEGNSPVVSLGGAVHKPASADLWWALTQPRGGCFVRMAGWMFRKILRASAVDVTVDAQSFSATVLAQSSTLGDQRRHIVLAPNHRSFFDFVLISYLAFALPELHIEIPFIAAADDFERIPLIGWLAARANAFFLRRGRGKADPSLRATLNSLKADRGERGTCVEVFIEGSRSRDRRYLRPRSGLLR